MPYYMSMHSDTDAKMSWKDAISRDLFAHLAYDASGTDEIACGTAGAANSASSAHPDRP